MDNGNLFLFSFSLISSPSYQLASKSKNKNKNMSTLKEAPLVDPEPTSDISNFNAPNVPGHGTKNGNVTASSDATKAGAKQLQGVQSAHGKFDYLKLVAVIGLHLNFRIYCFHHRFNIG